MIAETGHFALILALATALVQFVVPLYGAAKGDRALMNVAAPTALAQLFLIVIAFLIPGAAVWRQEIPAHFPWYLFFAGYLTGLAAFLVKKRS